MVRILVFGAGETIKSSDELAIIVSTVTRQVVEIYIKDHDAPLLSPDRSVRLQFSGERLSKIRVFRNAKLSEQ